MLATTWVIIIFYIINYKKKLLKTNKNYYISMKENVQRGVHWMKKIGTTKDQNFPYRKIYELNRKWENYQLL